MRIYIYSNKWIEVARINDPRYNLLREIVSFEPVLHQAIAVQIPLEEVEKRVEEMLPNRLQDNPDYGTRFKEEDIFSNLIYKDQSYKLCNTGYDSSIIFLIRIYNAGIENSNEFIIYTSNNHREFEDWRKSFEI